MLEPVQTISLQQWIAGWHFWNSCTRRLRLKCDDTCAETRFGLSPKRTSPFKSTGASVQSTTGSRGVRISGSNAGYTTFRGSVKGTGYPLHSPVFPLLPLLCVTVWHYVSTGLYILNTLVDVPFVGLTDLSRPYSWWMMILHLKLLCYLVH
jgi:hypothetical protein